MHSGGDHHKGSGNDAHDDHGEKLLADVVGGFAMEFLDLEHNLLVPVVVFNSPAPEVEFDDLLFGKSSLVEQIGEQHRGLSVGADQSDDSQLHTPGFFPLPAVEPLKVLVGRGDPKIVLLPATADKGLDSRKSGRRRTPEQKVALVVISEVANELVAWVAAIEEQHRSGRNRWQEILCLLTLRAMDIDHTPGHGKAPEHIVGRGNQTLGVVTFAFVVKATLRVELVSDLFCRRKIVLGTVEGNDRHRMPKIGGITGKKTVGQINGSSQDVTEDGPGNLLASTREPAAMHALSIGPESTAPGSLEKLSCLDVHTLALPTGGKRENEGNELGKGKLPIAGKILGGAFAFRINFSGDERKKRCDEISVLAWFFKAGSVP
jgi:hypothetical protein